MVQKFESKKIRQRKRDTLSLSIYLILCNLFLCLPWESPKNQPDQSKGPQSLIRESSAKIRDPLIRVWT